MALGLSTISAQALDARYTDANGDLVADRPADVTQQVDPDTLIFAYTPAEDPAVYARVWAGFLDHLAEVTGKKVEFFPVQSDAAQIEAMRAGRLHIAGYSTGPLPLAVNCAGFVPFAIMTSENGDYGYEMEIITYPGSAIREIPDIKGRTLAFTSESSNSGYKAPAALLRDKFGLEPGVDYEAAFSGKHDNSILGVANKDYPAAAIASGVRKRMVARDVVKADAVEVIYASDTFPTPGYGYAHNLTEELSQKIEEAFFTFDWNGSALLEEFQNANPPMQKFSPINYQKDWDIVRQVDAALGVTYECR